MKFAMNTNTSEFDDLLLKGESESGENFETKNIKNSKVISKTTESENESYVSFVPQRCSG